MNELSQSESAELIAAVAAALQQRGETLGVVETAAGGRLSDLITDRPGCSAWFGGGVIAYSQASKRRLAGPEGEARTPVSAVSAESAEWLAAQARRWLGTDWGIGETGITGPQTGRRSTKPAGLAYVAVAGPQGQSQVAEVMTGRDQRSVNKHAFARAALQLLLDTIQMR